MNICGITLAWGTGIGDPEILGGESLLVPQLFVAASRFDSVDTIGVGRLIGQIHIVASGSNHCYSLGPIAHLLRSTQTLFCLFSKLGHGSALF
jgi:hypothetical protein